MQIFVTKLWYRFYTLETIHMRSNIKRVPLFFLNVVSLLSMLSLCLSFRWWCLWWFFGLCLCLFEIVLCVLRTCANTRAGPPAPPNSFIGAMVVRIPFGGKFSRFVSCTTEYRFRAAISCFTAFPVFPASSTSTHSVPIPLMFLSLSSHDAASAPNPMGTMLNYKRF